MLDLATDAMTPHLAMWSHVDPSSPPDDVAVWLTRAASAPPNAGDAHRRYIDRHDGPQHADPPRTARYRCALADVRARADRGEAITLDAVARVQGVVLGLDGPAPLRVTDAFAHGGAHRYPYVAGLDAMVRSRLARADDRRGDIAVRACALYLDVIYTHPFDDGNTRAANLCLEWVFRRARRATPRYEDLLRVAKRPGDARAFWRLVRVGAASIVGQTQSAHP